MARHFSKDRYEAGPIKYEGKDMKAVHAALPGA